MSVKRLGKGLEALIRSDQDKENSKHNLLKAETESNNYPDISITESVDFEIWGVVTHTIHNHR